MSVQNLVKKYKKKISMMSKAGILSIVLMVVSCILYATKTFMWLGITGYIIGLILGGISVWLNINIGNINKVPQEEFSDKEERRNIEETCFLGLIMNTLVVLFAFIDFMAFIF